MANVHRIGDYGNNNNNNFQGNVAGAGDDVENQPGYVNIPFISKHECILSNI